MEDFQFKPAWWLRNSHLQTIWPVLLRTNKSITLERERIELPDKDFIDLDWVGRQEKGPLVLILHGFEGSIHSHYAKGILDKIAEQGWRGVFMHFRGCSEEPNRLQRGYHSGDTQDVAFVVDTILKREPNTPIAAIGYSMGGNVLLKWLGETQDRNPLHAGIAISVPFELHKAADRIQKGFSRFYQWYFMKCLRQKLFQKFKRVPPHVDPEVLKNLQDIREFDNHYTAPLYGFSDAYEYYKLASSRQFLSTIQVPTLVVHAKDDPFTSEDMIPSDEELSAYVQLEITETGGHVGFISGKYPWRPEYWLEKRIPLFLKQYLG